MEHVRINRFYKHSTKGTLGEVYINKKFFCYSLELPDRNNAVNISCIPGNISYDCDLVNSPKFGEVYEVKNVYNRTNILIHVANFLSDIKGCIALGLDYGDFKGKRNTTKAVWDSSKAFDSFMEKLKKQPFQLTITEKI